MTSSAENVEALLLQARDTRAGLGDLLQHYRPYLVIAAGQLIDPRILSRVCAADLVQEALAETVKRFDEFRGTSEAEFSAWVQQILAHTVDGAVRVHVLAEKRTVTREKPFFHQDGSASFYWFDFAGSDSTPSKCFVRGERALRLAKLVDELPGNQGAAIRMRFLQGMRVREVADALSVSSAAAAGLLKRGLRSLRTQMNEESWFSDAASSHP